MGSVEKKERFEKLTGAQLLWASTMGATFDLGIMSKGMLIPSMKTAAQRLILHQMQKNIFPFFNTEELTQEVFESIFDNLNDFIYFANKYEVLFDGDTLTLKINRDACMYCPTGVGGSQLGFAVCPYPQLFSVYLDVVLKNSLFNNSVVMVKESDGSYMKQDGEWDIISFKIEEDELFDNIRTSLSEGVKEVEETLLNAIQKGVITEDALWDRNYIEVDGTNPQKYKTKFTDFAKEYIQPIEDKILQLNKRFIFVVLVDENGYLPSHNTKYDKPLTGDYKKDLVGNRSMRIFNDPTGLAAARNTRPLLLQPYPRDVGVLMYDISSPVYLNGHHWGGLRIGFK